MARGRRFVAADALERIQRCPKCGSQAQACRKGNGCAYQETPEQLEAWWQRMRDEVLRPEDRS
jgi:hypothetical protein